MKRLQEPKSQVALIQAFMKQKALYELVSSTITDLEGRFIIVNLSIQNRKLYIANIRYSQKVRDIWLSGKISG